jgi:serine/threonine-protein kinase
MLRERYQVRRVVADGGMGRVYEALDMVERRNVALKILHPEVAQDEVALQRFRREYDVSKLLPHQHIVEVLDFQPTGDGSYALVMEFLYGEELRATLKREQVVPPERLVRIMSQMAIALDESHAKKLVHRDLKPDNVFLVQTNDGDIAKILDFGSVKDKADNAKKLTVMGTTIGSPFYMAPEQAQGLDTLDHRADVWALAAMAYEAVTGQVPFQGSNGPSILLEILTKEPKPPSAVGQGKKFLVPPTLDRVMAYAFKKSPALRIPSAGAFADALGAAYGLEGDHNLWAATPQTVLAEQISQRLPALLAAPPPPQKTDIADSFFGEMGALDVMGEAGPGAPAAPHAAGAQAGTGWAVTPNPPAWGNAGAAAAAPHPHPGGAHGPYGGGAAPRPVQGPHSGHALAPPDDLKVPTTGAGTWVLLGVIGLVLVILLIVAAVVVF